MFVRSLATDTGVVLGPAVEDIRAAITALDGKEQTIVTIGRGIPEDPDDHHLAVGGGSDLFIVYMTDDNLEFWNLTEKNRPGRKVTLTVGGQEGDYTEAQCVSRETAIAAAEQYARDGTRDEKLTWVRQ